MIRADGPITATSHSLNPARLAARSPGSAGIGEGRRQIGAVIGREFSYPLIAAAAPLPEQGLRGALSQLGESELIYQRGVAPNATYQFKHALVQDASHASLVRTRHQQLHGAVARALEERFADTVRTEPETLAHHFTEAGLPEKGVGYWFKAGQRTSEHSADQEALSHLERGLTLLKALPESVDRDRRELDFQIALDHPIAVEEDPRRKRAWPA